LLFNTNGFLNNFNRLRYSGWLSGSQTFLSATQNWVWWTPRDPSFKQRKKK